MELRREQVTLPVAQPVSLLHVSDVHFSARTSHEKNMRTIEAVTGLTGTSPGIVCVTGDLVSRKFTQESLDDAAALMQKLRQCGEVLYSLGNHEMDLPEDVRRAFLERLRALGVTVLDNESVTLDGICFTGVTLPQTVYKNPDGSYLRLAEITRDMVENSAGACPGHPCVLLAHTPLGYSAYAEWGADLVLSGHIHGGIVRIGGTGLLSPERRFLPKYTKGLFRELDCCMNVSAGIGKLRVNNPAEIVCIDIEPLH